MNDGVDNEGGKMQSKTWSLDSINQQTQLRASVFRCGSGATLLLGSSVGRISIRPSPKPLAQAKP